MTAPKPPPVVGPGSTSLPEVGAAGRCEASSVVFTHRPARFVWHHIQPQAAGGKTEPANLAQLCDNCHYATHAVLYALARGEKPATGFSRKVRAYARRGFEAAQAAGTLGKIPRQG